MDNTQRLFYIVTVEDENAVEKRVYCEHISSELLFEFIGVINKTTTSAVECIRSIMSGSSWTIGTVDSDLPLSTFTGSYINRLEALTKFADSFGAELYFETILQDDGTLVKKVHVYKQRGSYTGKRFEYGKDILNIKKTVDMGDVKTAIFAYGSSSIGTEGDKEKVTFKDVVWSKANGDPMDKPLGQEYLGDEEAKKLYGLDNGNTHRFGKIDAGQTSIPENLLIAAYNELIKVNKPKITYELSVIELERISGYEHEKVRLGDQVVIIDYEFQTPLVVEARVIKITRNLLNPEKTEIVLGNFITDFSASVNKLNEIEDTLNDNAGIWDNKMDKMSVENFVEFGLLVYDGTTSKTLEYKFAQVYVEEPTIQAQLQLIDEDIESVSETVQFFVQPIKTGEFYTGGKVRIVRSASTQRRFAVTIHAYCSIVHEEEEEVS